MKLVPQKGSDRRPLILIFRLDFGVRNVNHVNELVSISEILQSREDKIPVNSIKGFYSVYLIHRLCQE